LNDAKKAGNKAEDATKSVNKAVNKLDKSPSGPGTVPKSERDPKRVPSAKEKKEQLENQNNKCLNCDKKINEKESGSHHYPKRHSDGGSKTVQVFETCHKDLHKKD
jgi:nitrate reductase cytochrome c-type subunit